MWEIFDFDFLTPNSWSRVYDLNTFFACFGAGTCLIKISKIINLLIFIYKIIYRINAEEEKFRLEKRIEETKAERDACQAESEELKMQIHILEDRNDCLQNQLQETQRRLKESKNFA